MARADYIKCVRRAFHGLERQSYCGRDVPEVEWAFTGPDHATENGMQGGRLIAGPQCRKVIAAAMAGKLP